MSSRYLQLFLDEARDVLARAESATAALRSGRIDAAAELARAWHSLKGMSAALDLGALVAICNLSEDLLKRVRRPGEPDMVAGGLPAAVGAGLERTLAAALEAVAHVASSQAMPSQGPRLRRPRPGARVALPRSVKVPLGELDAVLAGVIELEADARRSPEGAAWPAPALRRLRRRLERLRLAPFDLLQPALERVVADACARLGRAATLQLAGGRVLMERDALELLAEVLPHILRNAVAHGLEDSGERTRAGKPAGGRLEVRVESRGRLLSIRVEDDGRGVDQEALSGLLGGDAPSAAELTRPGLDLSPWLCRPGLSTRTQADDVSGRGIGLEAVRERLRRAGGSLCIHARAGCGLAVEMVLPASLAVTRCLVVRLGELHAGVPLSAVRALEACEPAVRLTMQGAAGMELSLAVDQVLGRLETVVRPLPAGGRGCATLGTAVWEGKVPVLIVDPAALARIAAAHRPGPPGSRPRHPAATSIPATDAGPAAG